MATLGWHFLHPDSKLRTGENAPADGEWLIHDGPVVPCESGLHMSERAIDALRYHPGEERGVLCRVEVRGEIVPHGDPVDKLAASERRILWRLDGGASDRVLREFARWCALQVIHLWDAPNVVRRYLKAGDEELRDAARDAAQAALEDADRGADRAAAWAVARAAARDAAWIAARDAAWIAAWGAAQAALEGADRDADRAAARDAQNANLEEMFGEARS